MQFISIVFEKDGLQRDYLVESKNFDIGYTTIVIRNTPQGDLWFPWCNIRMLVIKDKDDESGE